MSRRFNNNITITSGSSLGIYTSTPTYLIDVTGNSTTSSINCNNTTGPALIIGNYASSSGNCMISALNENLTAGSTYSMILGKNDVSNNAIQFTYNHIGDNVTSNNLGIGFTGNSCVNINSLGYMGVGISSPQYPLHLSYNSNYQYSNLTYKYQNNASYSGPGQINTLTGTVFMSMNVTDNFMAGEFDVYSDRRIKKNINVIDIQSALEKVNRLTPITYQYIDSINYGNKQRYGFIAQDVEKIIENASTKIKDYIPNIYSSATVDGNVLTLTAAVSTDVKVGDKLKLFNNKDEVFVNILLMNDPGLSRPEDSQDPDLSRSKGSQITIDTYLQCDRVFVYGTEVNDAHILNYDAIFTVGIAALKELDNVVQIKKQKNKKRLELLKSMSNKLHAVEQKVTAH